MTVGAVLKDCIFRKYATGAGRASRREFFVFYVLFLSLWRLGLAGLVSLLGPPGPGEWLLSQMPFLLLPPLLAVSVRRLHDTGRTGWLALLLFLPLLNLLGLGLLCLPGTPWPNCYGPAPGAVRPG